MGSGFEGSLTIEFTHDGSVQFSVGVVYSSIKYTHVSVLHGSMHKDSTFSREGAFGIPFHVRESFKYSQLAWVEETTVEVILFLVHNGDRCG